jgi:hypothetical protein
LVKKKAFFKKKVWLSGNTNLLYLDIDNCVSKDFFAYYPHHTTCTLYSADTEEQPIYTTSPGVHKVANFTIPMPALTGVAEGEKVDLTIKMYFGEVELRVEGTY